MFLYFPNIVHMKDNNRGTIRSTKSECRLRALLNRIYVLIRSKSTFEYRHIGTQIRRSSATSTIQYLIDFCSTSC
jgi:hypothetical protein